MPDFAHLHVHTQYSLLDGATHIENLVSKAVEDEMKAVAITDHGNMFGVFKFVAEANKQNLKPVIGCEFYLSADMHDKKDRKRFHQVLLAKNEAGYRNLSKLCSLGFLEGMYYKPRIDKNLIKKHLEGIIATTCCLQGEVPRAILDLGEEKAESIFKEWLDIFGEDYYIELQRHDLADQNTINEVLIKWSKKYHVKMIATNDVHYLDQNDAEAHDLLLCIQTGKDLSDPNRMRFSNDQFFFKTKAEMTELFSDIPEALDNTMEVVSKVETLDLRRDILLPNYKLPQGFKSEDEYLKHISYEGAKLRYGSISDTVKDRLQYELEMVGKMGFAGYFLIVQDFVKAAEKMGVLVGPGRGSAAGSAVAYCTGITNIDPIKYNLLFERFLNPERVSMPDIDIDFDDEGRQKVIDYVVEQYGKEQVAPIITFGSMKARSAIRDVARVLNVPLHEADKMAKLVPEGPKINLAEAYKQSPELADIRRKGSELQKKTLKFAESLEGSVRHSGIHAAGIIIAPKEIRQFIPVCRSTESELNITQFEGKYIEDAGMLKMDFLGLTTLSIIKDTVKDIKRRHDVEIDINEIPLDDAKTFELYQAGDTIGTFQFESDGMRAYLKELKPTDIEDLIAMNALYRPGPMSMIPEFIDRKYGRKKIEYAHESLIPILENTYGIMVYQEQIMQTAQIMGGFTLGAADILRRAMGKKKLDVMQEQKEIFVKGAREKNIDQKVAEEVFGLMERFAEYGFNRSHSTAYSILAFHTAYLKAHYPAEYMAAVLTHNMSNLKKIDFYLNSVRKMGLEVLGPDINESYPSFTVNQTGAIRFGLAAVKGVGQKAMDEIVTERDKNGSYRNLFELTKRLNIKLVNKRCFESLVYAGALDCFKKLHRAQYFYKGNNEDKNLIEIAIKFASALQAKFNPDQHTLFGKAEMPEIREPDIYDCEPWSEMELLKNEKEVTGIYLSGHPLDRFKIEIDNFCSCKVSDLEHFKNKDVEIAGMISGVRIGTDKYGKQYAFFTIEDYSGKFNLSLFSEGYLKMRHFLVDGETIFIKGRMQMRNNFDDRIELRIKSMMLLNEVLDKEIRFINIHIPLSDISDELMNDLNKIIEEHPGKCELKIKVFDQAENISVMLPSQNVKLHVDRELIKSLESVNGLKINLN